MKKNIFFFLFFLTATQTFAQTDSLWPKKSLHFELGGSGGFWSVSAERSLGRHNWYLQYGLSYIPTGTQHVLTVPVLLKKTFGQKSHRLETGIGQGFSLALGNGLKFFPRGLLEIGWRYQQENSPWIFRVLYTPIISYLVDMQYQHWGGIGIGYQINLKK